MTEPKQDDLTADDRRVEPTGNGPQADDPPVDQQPPQDPAWLPEGTQTAQEADQ